MDKHAFYPCLCCKHGPFADFSREVAVDFAGGGGFFQTLSGYVHHRYSYSLVNIEKAIEHGHFKLNYPSKMWVFHSRHVSLPEGIGVMYPNIGGKEPSWLGVCWEP